MLQKILKWKEDFSSAGAARETLTASSRGRYLKEHRTGVALMLGLFLVMGTSISNSAPLVSAQEVAKAAQKADNGKQYRLPKKYQASLNEIVVPAFQAKQYEFAYPFLVSLMSELPEEGIAEVERLGKAATGESILKRFTEIHLKAVERQQVSTEQKYPLALTLNLCEQIASRLDEELDSIRQMPALAEKPILPEKWNDSEKLFWEIHVLNNRLNNLTSLANYSVELVREHLLAAKKRDQLEVAAKLEPSIKNPEKVLEVLKVMRLNEAELRLVELRRAVKELKETDDFETRLYAAYALIDDGNRLMSFFKELNQNPTGRPTLDDPAVPEEVATLSQEGKQAGKDVIDKAIALRVGAHWWLRGRYGMATMAGGLLKDPAATTSPAVMFGLYMPKEPDKPISSFLPVAERYPGYDRRHYYNWAVEYRPLMRATASDTEMKSRSMSSAVQLPSQEFQFW